MSETDSFIEEVTEEVRKDQLFGYYKKYGWIAGVVIALIVGGAAYFEWSKNQAQTAAQLRGDAIVAALTEVEVVKQVAALDNISADAGGALALIRLQKAAVLATDGQNAAALETLNILADDTAAPQVYRDMARFKALILGGKDMNQGMRMTGLELLATPGNGFRPMALEQIAVTKLDAGDVEGAIAQLSQLLSEPEISREMRQRAIQLLVSLGGQIPTTSQLLLGNETAQ